MDPSATLAWADGALTATLPDGSSWRGTRPADLAATRLDVLSPPSACLIADGAGALAWAYGVLPFVRRPLPPLSFGAGLTPAACEALRLLSEEGRYAACDDRVVLRGEIDDFILFARRHASVWSVGALTVCATTLTVRFEDLWYRLPPALRHADYEAAVVRDPTSRDAAGSGVVREVLPRLAPDVRLCLDLADQGGFVLSFTPVGSS